MHFFIASLAGEPQVGMCVAKYAKSPFTLNTLVRQGLVGRIPVISMQLQFMPLNPGVEVKKIPALLERKLKRNFVAWKMTTPIKTIEAAFRLTALSTFQPSFARINLAYAFLMCNKTLSKVKYHAVGVTPTAWNFLSLSLESQACF